MAVKKAGKAKVGKAAKPEAPVFQNVFWAANDLLRKDSGSTSVLDYVEQSSWPLFLKNLDPLGQDCELEVTV